jgi:hypothetical protein
MQYEVWSRLIKVDPLKCRGIELRSSGATMSIRKRVLKVDWINCHVIDVNLTLSVMAISRGF